MSQQKIRNILNSMKKTMDCPICLDLMSNPISTTCNHHFCKFCLNEFIHKKRHTPCPMCHVSLTKRSFQENSKLKKIIERLKNLLSAAEKDTMFQDDKSLADHSLLVNKRGIKRKVHSNNNKPEVLEVTKVENAQLNGETLAKEIKGHELHKSLKNYSRGKDVHKNRKRIVEWLQQLPSCFNDWNEDNFGVETSQCEEFQPPKNNMKRMPMQCISNSPLKDNVCVPYDLISLSETYSIHSEAINGSHISLKECLNKEQNTILSTTTSNCIHNITKRKKRSLNPRKKSTSYKRLKQLTLKKIEQAKKLRAEREINISSSVNTTSKNYIIDLTSLMSVSPHEEQHTTEDFNNKRKTNEIVGTEKHHEKSLMKDNLGEDKIKNQQNKSELWEDSKLTNIQSVQTTTSSQNLHELRGNICESPAILPPTFIAGTPFMKTLHGQLADYNKCNEKQSFSYDIHQKLENGIDVTNVTRDPSSQINLINFNGSRDTFVTNGNICHEQLHAKSDVLCNTSVHQGPTLGSIHDNLSTVVTEDVEERPVVDEKEVLSSDTDDLKICPDLKECESVDLEIQAEDVRMQYSFLNNSDRNDSDPHLSPLKRVTSESNNCSSIKSASRFKSDSLISSDVELIISDKTNNNTSDEDTNTFSKPLHNSQKGLAVIENSQIVDDRILPCNVSNLSTSNRQMSTKENCNDTNEYFSSSYQETIPPVHDSEMLYKTDKSLKTSSDSKSLSNFLLVPDFKLVDYTPTQNSVTSEDNIKLKESILSQDLEINNEKQLNTEKYILKGSKDSLYKLENCKENAKNVSQNTFLEERSLQDKNIKISNCKSDDDLNNSYFPSIESDLLFSSNSKIDSKEIYDNLESSQQNNNSGNLVNFHDVCDNRLTTSIMNISQDMDSKNIIAEFPSEAKPTIPDSKNTISEFPSEAKPTIPDSKNTISEFPSEAKPTIPDSKNIVSEFPSEAKPTIPDSKNIVSEFPSEAKPTIPDSKNIIAEFPSEAKPTIPDSKNIISEFPSEAKPTIPDSKNIISEFPSEAKPTIPDSKNIISEFPSEAKPTIPDSKNIVSEFPSEAKPTIPDSKHIVYEIPSEAKPTIPDSKNIVSEIPSEAKPTIPDSKNIISEFPSEAKPTIPDSKNIVSEFPSEAKPTIPDSKHIVSEIPSEAKPTIPDSKHIVSEIPSEAKPTIPDSKNTISEFPSEAKPTIPDFKNIVSEIPSEAKPIIPDSKHIVSEIPSQAKPTIPDSKHIVSEIPSEPKPTIPKISLEKMVVLDSQESSMQPCKTNLIEWQPSSCNAVPCSVDLESNDVCILPELHKLYQNETSETDRKETLEEKVVVNEELFSQSLPVDFTYKEDISVNGRTTTIPTKGSALDSQIVIQTKRSKRKCFSLDGRCVKSLFSDKVLNCEPEINESSTKDINLNKSYGNPAKSEFNCISLGTISCPVEETEKQRLEKKNTSQNLSEHILSLQEKSSPLKLQKCPRKRRKSNEKNPFEIKCDNLKDSESISNQPKEMSISDEITGEKCIDPLNVDDSCSDSQTQAPSCDRESSEPLTDKTLSPMPLSLAPCSITSDVTSEPIVSSWPQHNVPLDMDEQNNLKSGTLTKSKEIELFHDTDIENSDELLPADNGIVIDLKEPLRIQSFSSNFEDSYCFANISQKCLQSEDKRSPNSACEVRNDSKDNNSEMSQMSANKLKENMDTIKSPNLDIFNTSNKTEMEPQRVGKKGSSEVRTVPCGENMTVDSSSLHDVSPHDVNISTQKNVCQVDCNSSNTAEVAGHVRLSDEFVIEKDELQKDSDNFGEKSTPLSKQADSANTDSSRQKECIAHSEKNDHLNSSQEDQENIEGIDNETVLHSNGTYKRSKRIVISESEAEQSDEGETSNLNTGNTRCSQNIASQKENFSTQLCANLENDLVEMKRQIALLEAKLGMDDSIVNEDNECRNELKLTPCQEVEIPVSDGGLKKSCDDKYMRLSSDEDNVIPDSFEEEPSTEAEKCLLSDANKKSTAEESEELFFSPSFQRSSSTSRCRPKIQNGKKRSQHRNRNHFRYKARCKNVPIIESDESDDSVVLPHEDGNGSIHSEEEVIPPDTTEKYLSDKKSQKHLSNKKKNGIKHEPCHISSNLLKSSIDIDFDEKQDEGHVDMQLANRLKQMKNLVATGLSNIDVHQVKEFCDKNGYKFSLEFSLEVTHVIVKTVSPQVRYCDRTLKYFQGIAHKCWVLSFQWIHQSLNNQTILKEADFEITGDTVNGKHHRGPTRSRLSNVNLLTSYQIYFTGETCELPLEVLRNLVKSLGGKLMTTPEYFDLKSKNTCLIISSGNQKSHKLVEITCRKKGVLLLSREWLLDSIAMYDIQSLDGYLLL